MAGLLLAVALSPVTAADVPARPAYNLAVVPRLPPPTVHRNWAPFADRLSRDTGLDIRLRAYRSISEFETDLLQGRADLAFMNPYHQVVTHAAPGYIPLVRDASRRLSGLLVVRKTSGFGSVQDLDGHHIAFPHPNAFGASLYLRALLSEQVGIRFVPRYLTTHANVYRHVILGEVAAGGGVNVTLERESPSVRGELRVLFETPDAAPHPLSAHPRVPMATRAALIAAVLAMADDAEGQRLLAAVSLDQPVRADYRRDYEPLERLRLERYFVRSESVE